MTSIATNDEAQTFQVTTSAGTPLANLPNGASLPANGRTNLNWEEYSRLSPTHLNNGAVVVAGQSTQLGASKFLVQIPLNFTQLTATDPILTYIPVRHPDTPGKTTFTINSFSVVEQTAIVGAGGTITLSLKIGATPVTGASVVVAVASRAPGAWIGAAAPSAANTGTTGTTGIKVVGAAVTAITAGKVIAQMILTYS